MPDVTTSIIIMCVGVWCCWRCWYDQQCMLTTKKVPNSDQTNTNYSSLRIILVFILFICTRHTGTGRYWLRLRFHTRWFVFGWHDFNNSMLFLLLLLLLWSSSCCWCITTILLFVVVVMTVYSVCFIVCCCCFYSVVIVVVVVIIPPWISICLTYAFKTKYRYLYC